MRKLLILPLACFLFACTSSDQQKKQAANADSLTEAVTKTTNTEANMDAKDIDASTWIYDFKNFRQAVYTKDKAKVKTYFDFPVGGEDWGSLVTFSDKEVQKREKALKHPELFYEADFDQYFDRIFDEDFISCIMKIKTAVLYKSNHAESPEIITDGQIIKLIVDHDTTDFNAIQLNMSYANNAVDENGEAVSEGEHNVIYIFEIIDHRKIKFKKKVFAG